MSIKEKFCKTSMGITGIPYNVIGTIAQFKTVLNIKSF